MSCSRTTLIVTPCQAKGRGPCEDHNARDDCDLLPDLTGPDHTSRRIAFSLPSSRIAVHTICLLSTFESNESRTLCAESPCVTVPGCACPSSTGPDSASPGQKAVNPPSPWPFDPACGDLPPHPRVNATSRIISPSSGLQETLMPAIVIGSWSVFLMVTPVSIIFACHQENVYPVRRSQPQRCL